MIGKERDNLAGGSALSLPWIFTSWNPMVYRAYGNTANFSHRSRLLIITVISTAFVHWIALTPRIHPPNCPFPFDDHHQNLIHRFRARPDSPPQTASRSIHVCGHNSHLRTDRRKWRDECSVPRALRCMQRRANNTIHKIRFSFECTESFKTRQSQRW